VASLVGKGLRTRVKETLRWLANMPMLAPHYDDVFAYQELNAHFQRVMRNKECRGRPHYTCGVLNCVHLAKSLRVDRVSVIEFAVAPRHSDLLSLGAVAQLVGPLYGVRVDVFGFRELDLPKPIDHRDVPNMYPSEGFSRTELSAPEKRAPGVNLFLGPIRDTLPPFIASNPARVGFIAFDVDLYSSAVEALQLFNADQDLLLPRVQCYFDDIIGFTYASFNGSRLAVKEFNEQHALRKISPVYGLRYFLPYGERFRSWPEQMYLAHILDHAQYGQHDRLVNWRKLGLLEES